MSMPKYLTCSTKKTYSNNVFLLCICMYYGMSPALKFEDWQKLITTCLVSYPTYGKDDW